MFLILFFTLSGSFCDAQRKMIKKDELFEDGRLDIALKSKDNPQFDPAEQGDCLDGWKDGTSVGLGCVLADLRDVNINETSAEYICKEFGEGGRLVEIFRLQKTYLWLNFSIIIMT